MANFYLQIEIFMHSLMSNTLAICNVLFSGMSLLSSSLNSSMYYKLVKFHPDV